MLPLTANAPMPRFEGAAFARAMLDPQNAARRLAGVPDLGRTGRGEANPMDLLAGVRRTHCSADRGIERTLVGQDRCMRAKLKSLGLDPGRSTLPQDPSAFSLLARMVIPADGQGEEVSTYPSARPNGSLKHAVEQAASTTRGIIWW